MLRTSPNSLLQFLFSFIPPPLFVLLSSFSLSPSSRIFHRHFPPNSSSSFPRSSSLQTLCVPSFQSFPKIIRVFWLCCLVGLSIDLWARVGGGGAGSCSEGQFHICICFRRKGEPAGLSFHGYKVKNDDRLGRVTEELGFCSSHRLRCCACRQALLTAFFFCIFLNMTQDQSEGKILTGSTESDLDGIRRCQSFPWCVCMCVCGGWRVAYIKVAIQWDLISTTDGRDYSQLLSMDHFRVTAEDV